MFHAVRKGLSHQKGQQLSFKKFYRILQIPKWWNLQLLQPLSRVLALALQALKPNFVNILRTDPFLRSRLTLPKPITMLFEPEC